MRRVIVSNIVSLDGYFDGPGRSMLLLNMDPSFDALNLERIEAADIVLLGPRSFLMFSGYWPGIADAPHDPADRAVDDTNRAISRRWASVRKLVVADGFEVPADNPWAGSTEVVSWADAAGRLREERMQGDGDIVVFASRVTWNRLLADDLIDELHLTLSPTVVGGGIPVFDTPRGSPLGFALLGAQSLPGSDNVLVRYAAHPAVN